MKRKGFIVKVKARGKYYYYIRVSERIKNSLGQSIPTNRNVYALGRKQSALDTLNGWKSNIDMFPDELKEKGFNIENVDLWLEQLKEK